MAVATIVGNAAFGTEIQVDSSTTGPAVFVTIEGIGDIAGPNSQMGEAEITAHSTGIPVRQFIPTLADPGEISFPCFWDPSDPTQSSSSPYGLESMFWAKKQKLYRQVLTDPAQTAYEFTGFVKQLGETYPMAGIATRNTVIRIIGQRTLTTFPLSLRPASAYLGAGGGSRSIFLKAPRDKSWKMEADQPWIRVPSEQYTGGGKVDISVAANDTDAFRVGHVLLPDLKLSFLVQQQGAI
jgi:hypothetical protein